MESLTTYPLDNTDYSADDAALFHSTRTTGIFADDDFSFSLTGSDNTIKLDPGLAWMRLTRFKGQVAALKETAYIDMGLPDSVYPRIDHVILQFNANSNDTKVVVKNGVASSNPQPPERSLTEALYEIHLLQVRREPGATALTAADVTDLRLNVNYCGLMADAVTRVDTSAINAQITALIAQLRSDIEAVKAGTAFVMKSGDVMTGNLSVPTPTENAHAVNKKYSDAKDTVSLSATLYASGWAANATSGYIQTITVSGLTDEKKAKAYPAWPSVLADKLALAEEAAKVRACSRSGNTMTFECWEEVPTLDIPIIVEVYV